MTTPKKKGARKKGKVSHWHVPATDPDFRPASILDSLTVDPTHTEELRMIYGNLILGKADEKTRMRAGLLTAMTIEDAPIEMVEELFSRILAMKREAAKPSEEKGRNWHVLRGFITLREEIGRPPSKPELREFLLARPKTYKNLPTAGDKTGWTRAWEATGLDSLQDRKPLKAKRPLPKVRK